MTRSIGTLLFVLVAMMCAGKLIYIFENHYPRTVTYTGPGDVGDILLNVVMMIYILHTMHGGGK